MRAHVLNGGKSGRDGSTPPAPSEEQFRQEPGVSTVRGKHKERDWALSSFLKETRRLRLARYGAQRLLVLGMLALGSMASEAHEFITTKITWTREISRVFQRRCISCHHEGGTAFDLSTYQQARPWAEAIKEEVLERRMPPWGAMKGFGNFRDEDGLSEMEIAVISSWVEGGAPQGDPNLLPQQSRVTGEGPMLPKTVQVLLASGSLTLDRNSKIAAVRPEAVPEGASFRIIAERPDGSVEPLLWLYGYAQRFRRTYYFKTPVRLDAGTRIRIHPAFGSVSLLLGK